MSEVVVILNPVAGAGRAARLWRDLFAEVDGAVDLRVQETRGPGEATDLARAAVADGVRLVIAAGGDGTAHETVQGLAGPADPASDGVAFGHLPLGTGCDLAIALGLPRNPRGLLRRILEGSDRQVDLGEVEVTADGGRRRRFFLNAANVGLGPAVAQRVQDSRWLRRLGTLAYPVAAVGALGRVRPERLEWTTDEGHAGSAMVLNLAVCNGPSFAGGMRIAPDARLDSGRLHVVVAEPLPTLAALGQLVRILRRRPLDHPAIRTFSCRRLELEGPALRVEADGEIPGTLPARVGVRPGGLRVRMPSPRRGSREAR